MSHNAASPLTPYQLIFMIAFLFRYEFLMTTCWSLLPEERPPFSRLAQQLQEYWEENHVYIIENTDTPIEQ